MRRRRVPRSSPAFPRGLLGSSLPFMPSPREARLSSLSLLEISLPAGPLTRAKYLVAAAAATFLPDSRVSGEVRAAFALATADSRASGDLRAALALATPRPRNRPARSDT